MTLLTKGMGAIIKSLSRSKKVSPTIKSVKPTIRRSVEESHDKVKGDAYLKNIRELNKHKENIKKGKESVKALHDMTKTRKAYFIGKRHGATTSRIHPYDPKKGKKQTGEDL